MIRSFLKNKFIITISDIHGVKQYTMHQFIKLFTIWIIVAIVIIFAAGTLFLYSLSDKVDKLNNLTQTLQNTKEQLAIENGDLQNNILRKSETLNSMNEQLSEIETIIGLEPNIESSFYDRANNAKNRTTLKIEKSRLTVAQLTILNRSIPNGVPIKYIRITDKFGYRIHPITKKRHHHSGIDMSAEIGTPIYAPADGVVEYAKHKGSYGNYLLINHPFGFKTAYGHLEKFAVKSGDYIAKGDLIGYVGNTGRSTGAHLHYEIRYLHKWLNPDKFLTWSSQTYEEVMASERLVNWSKLMNQIEIRLQLNTLNNTNKNLIRVSYGTF
ncbi:MAG TPA: M23 family metallopeptidase [Campylobacterales bacterium]|nr:M23 family metallopeptidase [Campylobacterales bacterium]